MSLAVSPFTSTFQRRPRTRFLVHAILIALVLIFVFPMLWMLSTSLKPIQQAMSLPPQWIPRPFQPQNFADAIAYIPFWTYTANTLTVCVLASLGTTLSSALVAYSFTRLEWPGRNVLFGLTLATMMIPFPVLM